MFAVRLHATGCSLRETQAILRLIGVERTHQAIWYWVHRLADSVPDPPLASPSRVAIDETAVKSNGDWYWVYAAIDLDSRLILDVAVFGRRGTDPAAAFLHKLTEKHDLSKAEFLVDQFVYRTALSVRAERLDQLYRPKPRRKLSRFEYIYGSVVQQVCQPVEALGLFCSGCKAFLGGIR